MSLNLKLLINNSLHISVNFFLNGKKIKFNRLAPEDLIEHLLSCKRDIVTVNCLYTSAHNKTSVYDRNTWQETDISRNNLAKKSPNYLMLEGYGETDRKYINDLRFEEQEYEEYIDDGYDDNSGGNDESFVGEKVNESSQKIPDMKKLEKVNNEKQKSLDDFEFEENKSDINAKLISNLTKSNGSNVKKPHSKITSLKKSFENLEKIKKKRKKKKVQKPNLLVKLDGVGACVLLVNADLHRKGYIITFLIA